MGRKTSHGVSYPDLSEFKVTTYTADVYSFRFEEPFGWAIFTVNNASGEFHIQSDWGSWQHRWPVGENLGRDSAAHAKPLAHFLGTCSGAGYVVDKLGYGEPRTFRDTFSETQTKDSMRRMILGARLNSPDVPSETSELMEELVKKRTGRELDSWYGDSLTHEDARYLWKNLDRWLSDHDMKTEASQIMAVDDLRYRCPELYDFLTGKDESRNMIDREVWELFEYRPSWSYSFLYEVLLPFFFTHLRDNVLKDPDAEEKKDGVSRRLRR